MYDTIIIGGGPAGTAAAVYAGRKRLKTILLTEGFGGQSVVSDNIGNWIGEIEISGIELSKKMESHIRAQETVEIKMPELATSIQEQNGIFTVQTNNGNNYQSLSLIITSGGRRRKLNVPGEKKYDGKGVAYCSTCDAPLFRGKDVAVIGGGNAGLEAAVDLLPYANKIYVLNNKAELKGDTMTQEQVKKSEKIEIIYNAITTEIFGETMVTGLHYKDVISGEEKTLSVGGVFVEIGSVPNSEFTQNLIPLNERDEIIIDHKTGATTVPGIFAAGDVTDEIYKQNNISVGDAVKATLSAYAYILQKKHKQD